MTKSELRTGMVVTFRDGRKCMVYRDCDYDSSYGNGKIKSMTTLVTAEGTWSSLDSGNYQDNLKIYDNRKDDRDIMKVEVVHHPRMMWQEYDPNNFTTIWERNEPKQMTVAEIEAILGYKIEIVSEK